MTPPLTSPQARPTASPVTLSIDEVCQRLDCRRTKVKELLRAGDLTRAARVGARTRVTRCVTTSHVGPGRRTSGGTTMTETVEEGLMADLDVVEREAREAREDAARLRADLADAYAQIQEIADAVLDADCGLPPLVDAVRGLTAHRNELRARVAAMEAAARRAVDAFPKPKYAKPEDADQGGSSADLDVAYAAADQFGWDATAALRDALRGGTSALDAVVSAAVAARVVAIRARVEAVDRWDDVEESMNSMVRARDGVWVNRDDVLSAIDATEGGAP